MPFLYSFNSLSTLVPKVDTVGAMGLGGESVVGSTAGRPYGMQLSSPAACLVSSREKVVHDVAGSAARRLDMGRCWCGGERARR